MSNVSRFIGVKSVLLLLLLSITFLNWHGYWYVFAVLPIVYALFFKEIYRYIDKVFVLFFLFGVWYSIFATKLSMGEYATLVLVCPMVYLIGKFIGSSENEDSLINVLFVLALSMATIYLLSIIGDTAKNGFYTDSRNIEIEGRGSDEEISATGIYSHLMLLTTFIAVLFARMSLKRKMLFATFAIMAFVASIRIQSRTAVVILILVILLALFVNFSTIIRRNLIMVMISLGALLFAANYAMTNYEEELGILERFHDDDVETGGYRTELAADVINKISEHPWGGLEYMQYAHNMWIDCARVAGIVPLFILLIITVLYIRSLWRIYRQKIDTSCCRDMIVIMGVSMLVYMNVEPILEGCPLLFAFFALFLGVMRGRTNVLLGYR